MVWVECTDNLNKIYRDDKSWQQSDSVCIYDGTTPSVGPQILDVLCVFLVGTKALTHTGERDSNRRWQQPCSLQKNSAAHSACTYSAPQWLEGDMLT